MIMNSSGITWIDWSIVFCYFTIMLLMGLWFSKRQKSIKEYFLASHSMSSFAVGISIIATLLSTISYLSHPGELIAHGALFMFTMLIVPISYLILVFVFIPFFIKLDVTSAYEYLEKRFNVSVRILAAVFFIFIRIIWMGVVIYTASNAMSRMTGININYIILGLGFIAVTYTCAGGMRAIIWTDVVQFFILLGGAVFTICFIMWKVGNVGVFLSQGWELIRASERTYPIFPQSIFTPRTVFGFVLAGFFWHLATMSSDQVAIQRYLSTRNLKEAQRSLWINFFSDFSLSIILSIVGIALLVYFKTYPHELPAQLSNLKKSGDALFPWFIVHGLPIGLTGLVMSALFAAAMSSLDSGIHSISTVITVDFRERFKRKASNELFFARVLIIIIGIIATLWGLFVYKIPGNIYEITNRSTSCIVGPLFGLFALGILSKRTTGIGAIIGALAGLFTGFLGTYCGVWGLAEQNISFQLLIPLSFIVSYVVGWLVSLFTPRPQAKQLKGLVYVRRNH